MNQLDVEFESVFQTYHLGVNRYLTRMVGRQEAEDLTQEVFVKIGKSLDNFRGESSLSTWIYRIATNAVYDHQRRLISRREEIGLLPNKERLAEKGMEIPSIEQQVISREMNDCIRNLVDELPNNYRTVLVLSEMEGFKNSEIAEITGLSLDNVKIRLHRARTKLKEIMEANCVLSRDERNELSCDRLPVD